MTEPLNWPALVAETLRRRKQEGLTQQQHAALANVSRPTIISFDRGDTTLSLAKAFDILRVVGMIDASSRDGAQEGFVADCLNRWRSLLADLPLDSRSRLPHGYCAIDYYFEGKFPRPSPSHFLKQLRQAYQADSLWSVFEVPRNRQNLPEYTGAAFEWWRERDIQRSRNSDFILREGDFWRANPAGNFFHLRGYAEDQPFLDREGKNLSVAYAIYNIYAICSHAAGMGEIFTNGNSDFHLRLYFTGLRNRMLMGKKQWHDATYPDIGKRATTDTALIEFHTTFSDFQTTYKANAPALIAELARPLVQAFDAAPISENYIIQTLKY